jgi:lysophospholipase L1-like esterase
MLRLALALALSGLAGLPAPAGAASTHSTAGAAKVSTAGTAVAARAHARAQRDADPGAITFDEVAGGTPITDQYRDRGVVFTSSVFVTGDGANPTSPVLSGTPTFQGPIEGRFVVPGTGTPTTVLGFTLDVGYINNRNSTEVAYYDAAGGRLGAVKAQSEAINSITVRAAGIASFSVRAISDEPAGFGIDNLSVLRDGAGIVPTRMASLGDAYSSGEGLLPRGDGLHYDCGTDLLHGLYYRNTTVPAGSAWQNGRDCQTDTGSLVRPNGYYTRPVDELDNVCHRGGWAYPNAVRDQLGIPAEDALFAACSGARTRDIRTVAQHPMSPFGVLGGKRQLASLADFAEGGVPDFITVGIGGNDAGFSNVVRQCMLNACLDDNDLPGFVEQSINRINGTVFKNVKDTLTELRGAYPNATIAAFGYPNPIGDPSKSCAGVDIGFAKVEEDERRWLKETYLPMLNDAIADAAAEAGVTYIDIGDVLEGHELCSGHEWINGLRPGKNNGLNPVATESFHPNQDGHAAIARRFMERYVVNGRLIFTNPPESPPLRPPTGPEIHLADVQAGAFQGLQPAACVQACKLSIEGQGFSPRTELRVTLHSDPVDLGTVTTDDHGNVALERTLPDGIEPGVHRVTFAGVDADGQRQYGAAAVEVYATAPAPDRQPFGTDLDPSDLPAGGSGVPLNPAGPISAPAGPGALATAGAPEAPVRVGGASVAPAAKVVIGAVQLTRDGRRVNVRVRCRARTSCVGQMIVVSGAASVKRSYRVAPGETATVTVKTTKALRRRLATKARRLKVVARAGNVEVGRRTAKVPRLRSR